MTSATSPERRIALRGASNFRDLGGYHTEDGRTVRWRHIFRADALHDLTPEDADLLFDLGLRNVFDLRTHRELNAFGPNPLLDRGARLHHVPLVDDLRHDSAHAARMLEPEGHEAHASSYLDMLETAGYAIGRILRHIAEEPRHASVFHCTGGRDRTGLVAALLLSVLGVPRRTIAADYALTTEYLAFSRARLQRLTAMYAERLGDREIRIPPTHAEVMSLTLSGLDERYGSPESYLCERGLTNEHQNALRRALLKA